MEIERDCNLNKRISKEQIKDDTMYYVLPDYNESGVLIMSVCDFLLNENSLEN